MVDLREFATPLHHLVLQKAHREGELTPPPFHQAHQVRQTVISGTRHADLLARLGGRAPVGYENVERGSRHGE